MADCVLYAVGKPVYHKSNDGMLFGAWMKDPQASSVTNDDKVWVTKDTDSKSLFEYKNKDDYRKNTQDYKQYTLPKPFHVSPSLCTEIGSTSMDPVDIN